MAFTSATKIALVGSYVPRKCGLATFTNDMYRSLEAHSEHARPDVLAVTDSPDGYDYPDEVRFEIRANDSENYRSAADFLNLNNYNVVSLQHEFGIFGGIAGGHVLALLKHLKVPVVTTCHTILEELPTEEHRKVFDEIVQRSARIVVMAEKGRQFLTERYDVPTEKIRVVPHGIHEMPFVDPNYYKEQFGVEGKTVLLTFGLLAPNKGIETVIEALPRVLERHPSLVYVILGATHPYWVEREGESYRLKLKRLAEERGITKNVIFHNRFVDTESLKEFIGAADFYVTPYLSREQITSGTLAYAFGAGKAVLSTPYYHAEELLADNRGVLFPFGDSEAVAEALIGLLEDAPRRHSMRKRGFELGKQMTWPKVASSYADIFADVMARCAVSSPKKAFGLKTQDARPYQLPVLRLSHLYNLTDSTGILHQAKYDIPDLASGYRTDDNALAFVLSTLLSEIGEQLTSAEGRSLGSIYLAFLHHAFDSATGRFRAHLTYDRQWTGEAASDDTHARALWALGTAIGRSTEMKFRAVAAQLFDQALGAAYSFDSARAWAHTLVGIHEYSRFFAGDRAVSALRAHLRRQLSDLFEKNRSEGWCWFEKQIAYEDARLSHALILSGVRDNQPTLLQVGLDSLSWLLEQETGANGWFSPVGDKGYFPKGGERARFNQNPHDVYTMTSACLAAYQVTRELSWRTAAQRVFEWFLGKNDQNLPVYDPSTGGCRNGLCADHVDQNQGTMASLSFYLTLVELKMAESLV